MGANRGASKNGKPYLSKNKSIKLYKEKQSKIQKFKQEVEYLKSKYHEIDSHSVQKFDDFPLSERTRKALKNGNYSIPTEIQKESIGLALKGHDILGAAKTGSGKTLAFVIPMLESLYCSGWTIMDGLGAIVITPTRELAYQIFEVLNKVGTYHHFSVALVIGGKDLRKEQKLLDKCNILICTPGRLLQHMDENDLFNAMNLKILILDEADRILDLGFEKTVNAILENLPTERQTLLFSATQTRSVKDLARLSLKSPVYVSVHEHAKYSTPENLRQNYMICEAHLKMSLLWSFIKSHKQQKILVFMASCKQVKYFQDCIIRMKPHVEVMALHGRLHQLKRMQIYDEFCRKNYAVMLATDVAARGLDFPNVNWVVQLDCPEDASTYIHRAGRTARYQKNGESLLVLLPSEKAMIEHLKNRKIPIEELKVNPQKVFNVDKKLETLCGRDEDLKDSGIRAFKAYLKNIFLMKDKTVFDVSKIDKELLAKSLGLGVGPRVRFLDKNRKTRIEASLSIAPSNEGSDPESDDDLKQQKGSLGLVSGPHMHSLDKNLKPRIEDSQSFQISEGSDPESDEDVLETNTICSDPESERDFWEVNKVLSVEDDNNDEPKGSKKLITKAAAAKRILKKVIKPNNVVKFDEDGNKISELCGTVVPTIASEIKNQMFKEGYSIEKSKLVKEEEEQVDKIVFQEKIKQKHREKRLKIKKKRKRDQNIAPQLPDTDDRQDDSESDIDPNSMMFSMDSEEQSNSYDDEEEEEEEEEEEKYMEELAEHKKEFQKSKKRKKDSGYSDVKRQKKDNRLYSDGRSLDDDEQLALNFLSNT